MDGAFKTYTSLCRNLSQADLDFLIFVQRNKIDLALCNLPIKKNGSHLLTPKSYDKIKKTAIDLLSFLGEGIFTMGCSKNYI